MLATSEWRLLRADAALPSAYWPDMADERRARLLEVLEEARRRIAEPGSDFSWSSWPDAEAALAELDGLIESVRSGEDPARMALEALFLPTGDVQEVAIESGWGDEFLALASRFDQAMEALYGSKGLPQNPRPAGAEDE